MELVYLWVEEYKNIKRQGFNFSSKFDCTFHDKYKKYIDEDGEEKERLEDNCDLIIEPKEHIENFFGENINVTAIVGKNGSGKSSVIEIIEKILRLEDIKEYIYLSFIDEIIYINTNIVVKINTELAYKRDNNHHFSLCTYYAEMPYPYEYRKKIHNENKIFTVNMQEKNVYKSIVFLLKKEDNKVLNNLDFIFQPTRIDYSQNIQYRENLIAKISNHLNESRSFSDYKRTSSLKENFMWGKGIMLNGLIYDLVDNEMSYNTFLDFEVEEDFKKNKEFYREFWTYEDGRTQSDEDIKEGLLDDIKEKYPLEQYIEKNWDQEEVYKHFLYRLNLNFCSFFTKESFFNKKNEALEKIDIFKLYLFNQIVKNDLLERYFEFIISNYIKYYLNIENIEALVKKTFEDSEIEKIEYFLSKSKISISTTYEEYKKLTSNKIVELNTNEYFGDYYNFFTFDFLDENERKFSYLSYGEKTFYGLIINIYTYLLEHKQNNNLLLCFDEPELSLHPKWQKEYLNKLFYVLKTTNQNIHLIFTSHSPFLLSDIPKQNIIFLDKDENGNCKVVNGLKEKKQTFGANIHTLLSDSFFMENGLMGEFAKYKINDVYNFIVHNETDKIKTKEEAQQIIDIIGDALVKRQLEELYNQKFNEPSKDEIIELLRKEIESLKAKNDTD